MKTLITAALLLINICPGLPQSNTRQLLLTELKSTHDQAGWFAPLNTAIDGLTATQASWKPAADSHSVGELVHHLLYWNQQQLRSFKGEPAGEKVKSNDETFDKFEEAHWQEMCTQLKAVMTDFESWVRTAPESELNKKAEVLTNISTHNAYHIGQMVLVRKLQGSWVADKGVK